jgi:hypothetical protein
MRRRSSTSSRGNATAEVAAQFIKKGKEITVIGTLKQDRWTTPEGDPRSKVVIHANRILLGRDATAAVELPARESRCRLTESAEPWYRGNLTKDGRPPVVLGTVQSRRRWGCGRLSAT